MAGEYLRVADGAGAEAQIPVIGEQDFGGAKRAESLGGDLALHHARISRSATGELVLYNIGGGGRIDVNGQPLSNAVVLKPGDQIQMGETKLELGTGEAEAAPGYGHEQAASSPAGIPPTDLPVALPYEGPLDELRRFAPTLNKHLPATLKGRMFPAAAAMFMQLLVGWEWFISGATKIKNGDFPTGLAASIRMTDQDAAGWYKSVLNSVLIPNAKLFGVVIEATEVVIGVILVVAGLLWLLRWERLREPEREAMLAGTVICCLIGIVLNVNFFLLTGANLPIFLAKDSFGEGVGLDMVLPYLETIIAVVAIWTLVSLRREAARDVAARDAITIPASVAAGDGVASAPPA